MMRISPRAAALHAVAGGLVLAGLTLATPTARAQAPIEKALPASTVAFLKIENAAALRQAFDQSQTGQLLADPGIKPIRDRLESMLAEPSQQLQQAVGVSIRELIELPQGPVSVAVLARDNREVPVALLVSADAGTNEAKMNEVMTRATQQAQEAGAKVATEQAGGVELTVIRGADANQPPLVWGKQGSVYRIGSDLQAVKDLIANASGREDSLASSPNYTQVVNKLGEGAQVLWFLDLSQAVALATRAAEQGGGNAQQVAAQMQILGVNSLKAIGGSLALNLGEYDTLSKIFVYAPGEPQGIFKLFPMPARDLRPQPWVPAEVASYQSISWDLDGAWNGLSELVDQFAPGVLDQVQRGLGGPEGNLDLKRDVFGPLGDRITIISDFKKPITEESQRVLFAVALEDSKTFQETLNKLFTLAGASPKERAFQGTTIYDFEIPAEIGEQAGIPGPVSLTIAKDHLLVSTEPSILEQVMRPGGPGLADSPEFQAVARNFPTAASTLSYQRPEQQARMLYNMVKSGQLQEAIKQAAPADPNAPDIDEVFDPELLPEFEVFEKYLAPGGGFGVMTPEGTVFTQFTTRKAQP